MRASLAARADCFLSSAVGLGVWASIAFCRRMGSFGKISVVMKTLSSQCICISI